MRKGRIAAEVREQIINRIKNDGIPVKQAAEEHGISDQTIYDWLGKRADTGMPSILEFAKLKRERDELLRLVGEITLKLSETQKKR